MLTIRDKTFSTPLLLAPMVALHRFGADVIDINLGCPAPGVRKSGGGSLLSSRVDQAGKIIRKARTETDLLLTAKIRLGERLDEKWLKDFCLMLEGAGIDILTQLCSFNSR